MPHHAKLQRLQRRADRIVACSRVRAALALMDLWPQHDGATCPPPLAAALLWITRDCPSCNTCRGACTVFRPDAECKLCHAGRSHARDDVFIELMTARARFVDFTDAAGIARAVCESTRCTVPRVELLFSTWPRLRLPALAFKAIENSRTDLIACFGRHGLFTREAAESIMTSADLPLVRAVRAGPAALQAVLPFVADVSHIFFGPQHWRCPVRLEHHAIAALRFDSLALLLQAGLRVQKSEWSRYAADIARRATVEELRAIAAATELPPAVVAEMSVLAAALGRDDVIAALATLQSPADVKPTTAPAA